MINYDLARVNANILRLSKEFHIASTMSCGASVLTAIKGRIAYYKERQKLLLENNAIKDSFGVEHLTC